LALGLALAACTSTQSFNSVATSCQVYITALDTATALASAGKLSGIARAKVEATISPASAICSGQAPSSDGIAVQKLTDAIVAVLRAEGN
jgi:hypothetical protein